MAPASSNDGWPGDRCRVLLYSDEPVLAKGLESLLRQTRGFDLLPTCNTVAALLEHRAPSPDVVLMDLTPEITFAVLGDIIHDLGATRVVLWANSISTELAFQAMGLGVRGILRKNLPTDLQITCLRKVRSGELWFEKALTDSLLSARRVALTQREGRLVGLLAEGLTSKQIASSLTISEGAVKTYLSRLFQKVGVKDRFELALFGLRNLSVGQWPASSQADSRVPRGSGTHIRPLPEADALAAVKPVQFYSCFISYSTSDRHFAERLHADLQANGVRCWFAPHNMKGGDRLHDQIERAIEVHDRLLLLLSEASMASKWVEAEIRKAFAKEKREARRVLFPLALVPFKQIGNWQCFDSDTGKDLAREVREYFIPDFGRWKDVDAYQAALGRLLQDLRAEVNRSDLLN